LANVRRLEVALVLCLCLALDGCGGQDLPDGYLTQGHLACSPQRPPVDVHVLIGLRQEDARRVAENQDCLLRIRFRDGEWQASNTILLHHPLLDVAVAGEKVIGVAPRPKGT
jgi:hypothetical protein